MPTIEQVQRLHLRAFNAIGTDTPIYRACLEQLATIADSLEFETDGNSLDVYMLAVDAIGELTSAAAEVTRER